MDKIISDLEAELERSRNLPAYEGLDVAWVAVVKCANLLNGKSEHDRMISLVKILPVNKLKVVLFSAPVETLLNLSPPLETILTAKHERLDADRTAMEMNAVRTKRENDPGEALRNLGDTLKRIRNRRAHGFKSPNGPRDHEILSASADILQQIGTIATEALRNSQID